MPTTYTSPRARWLRGAALGLVVLAACSRHVDGDHCDVPPHLVFQITDRAGASLITSAVDVLTISYLEDGKLQTTSPYVPQAANSSSTDYVFGDNLMPGKSLRGVTIYYLSFKGKTDTLEVKPQDECGYNPLTTFDGRAMPKLGPTAAIPTDYYQFRRR